MPDLETLSGFSAHGVVEDSAWGVIDKFGIHNLTPEQIHKIRMILESTMTREALEASRKTASDIRNAVANFAGKHQVSEKVVGGLAVDTLLDVGRETRKLGS